jgi:hypothetical protein
MKRVLISLIALVVPIVAEAQVQLPQASPKASLTQTVGLTEVRIDYNRPAVRGRQIWGALVPYGQVWRTGANEATRFQVSDDVTINGAKLPKGTYSLHTIPGETEWTIIFNSVADQWGSYSYDAANDVLRVKTTPRKAPHMHESMIFAIPAVTDSSADVHLAWENVVVPFTIGVDTNAKVLAGIRSTLGWRPGFQAAQWAFQNKVAGTDAMRWIDQSIAAEETWQNVALRARMLAGAGRYKDAVVAGERAVTLAKGVTPNPPNTAALEKEIADWRRR